MSVAPPHTASHAPADTADLFAQYQGLKRFSCLDGLRFICIFGVLWHHMPGISFDETNIILLKRGFLGVDFFFVISGFLITTLLLREEDRDGKFSIADFYWRRLLRILPVYYFVISAICIYYVWVKGEENYAPLVPYYFVFLANFLKEEIPLLGPMWSLAVEEQYYLIWPALLLLLPRRWIMPALIAGIAANVLGIMGAFAPLGIQAVETEHLIIALPNATYAPILMGSATAFLLHKRSSFEALAPLLGHWLAPVISFVAVLVIIQLMPPDVRGLPNLAIHTAMTACLISFVIRDRNILSPILTWWPIARVGQISYGIYIYHLIALHGAGILLRALGIGGPGWTLFIVYSLISIVIAEISFRTLEAYFMRFKSRPPWRKPRTN